MTHRLMSMFSGQKPLLVSIVLTLLIAGGLGLSACSREKGGEKEATEKKAEHGKDEHGDEHEAKEVKLSEETLKAAKLEFAEAREEAAGDLLRVTGSVETNQQLTQQVTPLVGGRVERVNVVLGDRVGKGAVLAVVSSPTIAEMHGKLHEAETKLAIATRNLERVQKAENRVAVLQAKAKLDEAEANLKRTRRLIELGAGAGKDLTAAETAYKTAQAEYDFQSNIALNREFAEARAAVDTARVDVRHTRDQLAALGAPVKEGEANDHSHDTSLLMLRAPVSGTVTERLVNAGAGIEAGKPLFTIANISSLWVIANVPEAQVQGLRVGTSAEVRPTGGGDAVAGRVTYLDPVLNEEARTARVRVEITNAGQRFKVGSFVEVNFRTTGKAAVQGNLVIPDEAVQRISERTIVFVPQAGEAGHFEVREIEAGGVTNGMRRVVSGLKPGERVVTKGSFTLKTQLQKGELEEDHH